MASKDLFNLKYSQITNYIILEYLLYNLHFVSKNFKNGGTLNIIILYKY